MEIIKPKKFNDNINGLTIYAEDKNDKGILKNLYLKKEEGENFKITIAKKGEFKNLNNTQILVLEDGQTIARIKYEKLNKNSNIVYGRDIKSNYQNQGLKLSKHFK